MTLAKQEDELNVRTTQPWLSDRLSHDHTCIRWRKAHWLPRVCSCTQGRTCQSTAAVVWQVARAVWLRPVAGATYIRRALQVASAGCANFMLHGGTRSLQWWQIMSVLKTLGSPCWDGHPYYYKTILTFTECMCLCVHSDRSRTENCHLCVCPHVSTPKVSQITLCCMSAVNLSSCHVPLTYIHACSGYSWVGLRFQLLLKTARG